MANLASMTDEQLREEQYKIGAARASAEAPFKEKQRGIRLELDKRAAHARLEKVLEGLPAEQRNALLADLQAAGSGEDK